MTETLAAPLPPTAPTGIPRAGEVDVAASLARMDAMFNQAPAAPPAAELVAKHGHTESNNRQYGELLRSAAEGTLGFDTTQNILDFARNISAGGSEVTVRADDPSARLKFAQQVRFARSLGYIVQEQPRRDPDGMVRVRIELPPIDVRSHVEWNRGQMVQGDRADDYGGTIPGEVISSLQAGAYPELSERKVGSRPDLTQEVEAVLEEIQRTGGMKTQIWQAVEGSVQYKRAIAEALGYHTENPVLQMQRGQYDIPVSNLRPGFSGVAGNRAPAAPEAAPAPAAPAMAPEAVPLPQPEYRGPKRHNIDPRVEVLARGGHMSTPAEQEVVRQLAIREGLIDRSQNRVIIRDGEDGTPHWGHEYPNVFTFDGTVRGLYEDVPASHLDYPPAMQLIHPTTETTHVAIEFDDGEQMVIRRTSGADVLSASQQTFEMFSSKGVRNGHDRRSIASTDLRGVVLIPGQPMVIGGRASSGRVARITSMDLDPRGEVRSNDQRLRRPERLRTSVMDRYRHAAERAMRERAGQAVGPLAMA